MPESAGDLTFSFGADFSGFTREVESAGRTLDTLSKAAAASRPLQLSGAMRQAATALAGPKSSKIGDDDAAKELSRLADQLALLQTTGAAHQAIAERMAIETAQARLGTDATLQQKQAVAALVTQIDAAKASQKALKAEQEASNDAWSFGADAVERGLDGVLLRGERLQDVARQLLSSVARQGLSAALTGGGSLAGLFGTAGQNGQVGGLFGAVQSLFGSGLTGQGLGAAFSGLYAEGGSIGAGRWGIVGEKGAEVVQGPATVTPWSKLAVARPGGVSAQQTITFNVTSPDAPSFARSEAQITAVLARAVGRGQRNS